MSIRRCVLSCIALTLAFLPGHAGSILLSWDSVSGATGYRVYYGRSSGQYTQSRDVGNTTSADIGGLEDCTEWFLAVKAYNSVGESPGFSNEIVGWARPMVTGPSPNAGIQGAQFTLDISGSNFQPGADVQVDNPDVFFDSPTVLSCNQIQVAATIEPTSGGVRPARIGQYTVTVVNPDDVYGSQAGAFQVEIAPRRFDLDTREGPSRDRIDGRDTVWLSMLFGSREGDPTYYPDSDFNGDGWVDGEDLAYLASSLGGCWDGVGWSVRACPQSLQ
jgi:hypothetical protein